MLSKVLKLKSLQRVPTSTETQSTAAQPSYNSAACPCLQLKSAVCLLLNSLRLQLPQQVLVPLLSLLPLLPVACRQTCAASSGWSGRHDHSTCTHKHTVHSKRYTWSPICFAWCGKEHVMRVLVHNSHPGNIVINTLVPLSTFLQLCFFRHCSRYNHAVYHHTSTTRSSQPKHHNFSQTALKAAAHLAILQLPHTQLLPPTSSA